MSRVATQIRYLDSTADVDEIVDTYLNDGAVILQNVLTQNQVRALNEEIEPYMQKANPGGPPGNKIKDFYGANTKRVELVPRRSKTYREEVLNLDVLHNVASKVFSAVGTYWLAHAQVIEIGPGSAAQPLHRDIQSNPAIMQLGPSGPETLFNFFVALSDFTEENGATRIAPGTHKAGGDGGFVLWQDDDGRKALETLPAIMNPGDVALYTGKTLHGGGANTTADKYRRGIAMPLQASFLTPVEAFPLTVGVEIARTLPERVQRILGFRTQVPSGSTGIWRAEAGELANYLEV